MKAALVSMQDLPVQAGCEFAMSGESLWQKAELEQILAIACHMRDVGMFEPCIFCRAGSELEWRSNSLGLPFIALKSGTQFGDSVRIWQWQRKLSCFLLLANGNASLPCARRFLQARGKKPVFFAPAFFLRPFDAQDRLASLLHRSRVIVCGSVNIRERLAASLEAKGKPVDSLHWLVHPPGLNLGDFAKAGQAYGKIDEEQGKHFVFGMAGSLMQHSGALLVVRAMSAIWQTGGLPPWEVRMLGEGSRFEEILVEALNLGVSSRLSILGSQFPGPVAAMCHVWLAPGSAFCELPETMGTAAAVGVPLICIESALHREWLHYMPAGVALEVKRDNPQELAKFMLAMMREEEERKRLAGLSRSCRNLVGLEEMAAKICAGLEEEIK